MRVIAGKYRSRRLLAPKGLDTRPSLDSVKEAMFNILGQEVINATVLDLFAGSGALGIEALSRGAKKVYFNDVAKKAYDVIKKNLENLGIESGYVLTKLSYKEMLKALNNQVDILILDPPYKLGIYEEIISMMEERNLFSPSIKIMIEMDEDYELKLKNSYQIKEYHYGNKKLVYLFR